MGREGLRRTESQFRGADGLRLLRRAWLPDDPGRVLLLVHGFAEHSGRYDHLGAWFAGQECAVHALDQRGHGGSEGARGHLRRFGEYLDDLDALLSLVRAEHPGLPVTLVGHSMGGLVVLAYLCERAPGVQSAVVSGALLALSDDLPRLRLRAARILARLAPRLPLGGPVDPAALSRDPEVVRRYREDPLVGRRMTARLAGELLDALGRTARTPDRVRVPLLLLHGEDDALCPVAGSRAFRGALRSPGSTLLTYPRLRHEIFNEPEHEQVFRDVLEWLAAGPVGPA
jgi:alpha-beta hydrolase superfamily lysophospholipase